MRLRSNGSSVLPPRREGVMLDGVPMEDESEVLLEEGMLLECLHFSTE